VLLIIKEEDHMWKMVGKMHFGNDAASHAEMAPGSVDKVPLPTAIWRFIREIFLPAS